MDHDAPPTGPDHTTIALAEGLVTVTLDDARAMKDALLRALDASQVEHREHLIRMTASAPVWIDPDGVVRIGAWLLERAQDAMALTFPLPSGGALRLRCVARVERAEGGWSVTRIDLERAWLRAGA